MRSTVYHSGNEKLLLLLIIALGILVRYAWILVSEYTPVIGDEPYYKALADALAEGKGYSFDGRPTAWWVPGWPFVMSLVHRIAGQSDLYIQLVNVALGGLTVLLTFAIGRRVFGQKVALIGALLAAVSPASVIMSDTLMSENLAVPVFLLVALIALSRPRDAPTPVRAVGVGVLCGALILVREQNYFVPAGIALYWLSMRAFPLKRRFLSSMIMLAVAAITLAPWFLRNESTLGLTGLSSSQGVNLYVSFNDQATGGYIGTDWEGLMPEAPGTFPPPEVAPGPHEAEVERHEWASRRAIAWARENPVKSLELVPIKLGRVLLSERWVLWFVGDYHQEKDDWPPKSLKAITIIGLLQGYWLLAISLAALAFLLRWRKLPQEALLVVLLTVALLLPHVAIFGQGRFHLSLAPFVFLFAAYAVCERNTIAAKRPGVSAAGRKLPKAPIDPPVPQGRD